MKNEKVHAGQDVFFPTQQGLIEFRAAEPTGSMRLAAIVTPNPVDFKKPGYSAGKLGPYAASKVIKVDIDPCCK